MKTAFQLEVTFEQVLDLVKNLPRREKIMLTRELEKEGIESKLNSLLETFRSKDLNLKTINEEVEIVRQILCENKEH
ncbi:MAG: hypothetical protein ABI266_07000 [Ginsengibacter sp.]